MTEFLKNLVGNDIAATFIMSVVPLIELKGGIMFARGAGLSFFVSYALAFLGSTLVFFPIFFLLKPLLSLLKRTRAFGKFAEKVENYFDRKGSALENKEGKGGTRKKQLGVFLFVAIPLPMTGVWTGTAVAAFLDLKFSQAILPVIIGNLVAGLIISLLAELCIAFLTLKSLDYILYGLFALAAILLVVFIIRVARQKPRDGE